MKELVSNSSSGIEIIAALITLAAAFITLIGAFISNKSFINQDGGSHIGYSLKNSKQQSQHVRSKAFQFTRLYMYMIISNIILYYCWTKIFSALVMEIGIDSIIKLEYIGWAYFLYGLQFFYVH